MRRLWFVAIAGLAISGLVAAAALQDEPQMPKPGKEQELVKQFEGEWDAAAKFWMVPGQPPMESKGVEKCRMALGGWWLIFDYKSTFMEQPFEGHGIMGYDIVKKKFVTTWADSMMPMLMVAEGDADKDGKVFTQWVNGVDPQTGKAAKEKWVTTVKDRDTYTMAFYRTNDEGKEGKTGEITYTRKK